MGKKKSLYYELTRKTLSKSKDEDGNRTPQIMFGVESRLPEHPFLEDWGERYQSIFRTAVNALQNGVTEDQIEKSFQGRFGIGWAWADSIATDANATIKQLQSSKQNRIEALKVDIESGKKAASETITKMELQLENPTKKNMLGFAKRLMGLESKIDRIHRKEIELNRLRSEQRLHICFGGSKLANAQHHLDENNYDSIDQWREDWLKKRSGNFYSVGKGRVAGNNPVAGIHHIEDDLFKVVLSVPTFLRFVYGKTVELEFTLDGKRKSDILYALEANKPITVSCFRREHKDDQWYIHLSSYIADIPTVTSMRNGCLGIDLNAKTIDVIYIKPDGNPERSFSGAPPFSLRRRYANGKASPTTWRCPPGCVPAFFSPEDKKDAGFGSGWRKISKLLRDNHIRRGQHFQPNIVLRLLVDSPQSSRGKKGRNAAVTLVAVLSHTNGREPPVRCAASS
jgi:hypothetical protein